MGKLTVEIQGAQKIDDALRNAQIAVTRSERASKIMLYAAELIAFDARNRAPSRQQVTRNPLMNTSRQGRLRQAIIARPLPILASKPMASIAKVNYSSRTRGVPTATHAHIVELGAKAHEIKPKNRKVLALYGGTVFRRIVHHPGQKPQPFFAPARRSKTRVAREYIREQFAEMLEQAAKP